MGTAHTAVQTPVSPEFEVHMLNDIGKKKAGNIASSFDTLLKYLEDENVCTPLGREMAIVRTKLEEACFFAKKAMAKQPDNQIPR